MALRLQISCMDSSNLGLSRTNLVLKKSDCHICGSDKKSLMLPSCYFNTSEKALSLAEFIFVVTCDNCGCIYTDPYIDPSKNMQYKSESYYNDYNNPLASHNALQVKSAKFKLNLIEKYLNLNNKSKTLDVGATGAFSEEIAKKYKNKINYLVEPSKDAIRLCKETFKKVTPIDGIYNQQNFKKESLDFISFFYSLYYMEDPNISLTKAYNSLKTSGRLLINIANVLMENSGLYNDPKSPNNGYILCEISDIVRREMYVLYDQTSLINLLNKNGFRILENLKYCYPFSHPLYGREGSILICEKDKKKNKQKIQKSFKSKKTIENFCKIVSANSIQLFCIDKNPKTINFYCNDDTYFLMIKEIFKKYTSNIQIIQKKVGDAGVNNADFVFTTFNDDRYNWIIDDDKRIQVFQRDMDNLYPNYWKKENGEIIMLKSCLPYKKKVQELFPWNRDPSRFIVSWSN